MLNTVIADLQLNNNFILTLMHKFPYWKPVRKLLSRFKLPTVSWSYFLGHGIGNLKSNYCILKLQIKMQ